MPLIPFHNKHSPNLIILRVGKKVLNLKNGYYINRFKLYLVLPQLEDPLRRYTNISESNSTLDKRIVLSLRP